MSSTANFFHPGSCEATEWGKRHGKHPGPQRFDDAHHGHLAKDKNWGPWSCCVGAANARGCKLREKVPPKTPSSATKEIQGEKHINYFTTENVCRVVGEEKNCWRLDKGHIAKKKTEGKVWIWAENGFVTSAMREMQGDKRIKFLTAGNVCKVVGEEKNCWRLDNGRIAKKKTEDKVWISAEGDSRQDTYDSSSMVSSQAPVVLRPFRPSVNHSGGGKLHTRQNRMEKGWALPMDTSGNI